jgi:hypothetical protein
MTKVLTQWGMTPTSSPATLSPVRPTGKKVKNPVIKKNSIIFVVVKEIFIT